MQVRWANVIIDEAQNIKNPATKQARAARRLQADFRLALTGTPVENRLSELWSIMAFLNPGYLGSRAGFRREFSVPIERYQDPSVAERLRRLVRPFVLRRLKNDPDVIRDLPDKFEHKVYCNLTREQATLYEAIVQSGMSSLPRDEDNGFMQRRGRVLAMLTRLKQVCNHPALFLADGSDVHDRSGKLNRLTEMLEEILDVGERALIFTQYAQMGFLLQSYLRDAFGEEVLFLHGGTPQRQRDRMLRAFSGRRRCPQHLCALAQGRWNQAEPDAGQPCVPLRSLVESRCRESGDGPRLPHRADAGCTGAQVHVTGDPGGAYRRAHREQA